MTLRSGFKILKNIRFRSVHVNRMNDIFEITMKRKQDTLPSIWKQKLNELTNTELARKMKTAKGFYRVEMAPPKFNEMKKLMSDVTLIKDFLQAGCYKQLTVKQAWLLLLVGTEVGLWFFMGETIGKMHIVGYLV